MESHHSDRTEEGLSNAYEGWKSGTALPVNVRVECIRCGLLLELQGLCKETGDFHRIHHPAEGGLRQEEDQRKGNPMNYSMNFWQQRRELGSIGSRGTAHMAEQVGEEASEEPPSKKPRKTS